MQKHCILSRPLLKALGNINVVPFSACDVKFASASPILNSESIPDDSGGGSLLLFISHFQRLAHEAGEGTCACRELS